jgi:hypothetical protein
VTAASQRSCKVRPGAVRLWPAFWPKVYGHPQSGGRLAGGVSAAHESDLTRAITIRNVALAAFGAAVLVFKSGYRGPFADVVNAYAGNVAVSFALYFAAINATAGYRWSRLVGASLTLVAVQTFEITNGFGVMENVGDPADLIANAVGVGLALIVDGATGRALRRRHEQRQADLGGQ